MRGADDPAPLGYLFNAWFFGVTTVLSVIGAAGVTVAPRSALPIARLWARLVLGGLRRLCGISWQARDLEHLPPEGPLLLASRHQSAFDTMIWLLLLPRCTYVMKQELARIPLFGRMVRPAGQIVVDRSGAATALRALVRDASAAAQAGRQIVIFPEGTRAAPGRPLPLQPGIAAIAMRTGLPVIPVVTELGPAMGTPGVPQAARGDPRHRAAPAARAHRRPRRARRLHAALGGGAGNRSDTLWISLCTRGPLNCHMTGKHPYKLLINMFILRESRGFQRRREDGDEAKGSHLPVVNHEVKPSVMRVLRGLCRGADGSMQPRFGE